MSTVTTESKGRPEWQIARKGQMARLDRETELNRQRQARLQSEEVFTPSVFVVRGEG